MVFRAIPRRPCYCFIRLIAKLKCVSCRRLLKKFCSYALSTHNLIENLRTKGTIFGEELRIRVKKFTHNLPEYFKSTKIAITGCRFSKIFQGSMPPDPLELFLFLNQLQICSAEKNLHLKKRWKLWPPLLSKFLATPLVHSDCITGP